ncbi:hypothetical protein EYF80_061906 [Liparis tanakae]|uniref:Uncharacterized protein n=1 Tax=Liparis tanakae TaxID=230148 RepID=A0A4Z2EGU4_9TELE|nr:hypothetical protein EYF80_061906 [Liparis tanakae]
MCWDTGHVLGHGTRDMCWDTGHGTCAGTRDIELTFHPNQLIRIDSYLGRELVGRRRRLRGGGGLRAARLSQRSGRRDVVSVADLRPPAAGRGRRGAGLLAQQRRREVTDHRGDDGGREEEGRVQVHGAGLWREGAREAGAC